MNDTLSQIVQHVTQPPTLESLILLFLGVGLTFGILERIFPAEKRGFVRPSLGIDLFYWLFTPIVTKAITTFVLVVVIYGTFRLLGWPITEEAMNGFGPISQQPTWLQALEALLVADFVGYWMHRWFHVTWLWRFHAVHHSPRLLDWLSAYRMHPLNDAMSRVAQTLPLLLVGLSPRVLISFIPFIVVYVVFLHANIRWTFGPLRFVLASPTFHRWHHTSEQEGIDRNYATIFPFWDLLFGTFYMPNRQPSRYGVKDNSVPETFLGQMLHPFVWKGPEVASDNGMIAESVLNSVQTEQVG
ncbi:MAG: sterol desaturase family protein [Planctomycetes bacterium]|nr:sterol desaturase family protein [Planctomycetota bacterium]